jgi:hypothetical protein
MLYKAFRVMVSQCSWIDRTMKKTTTIYVETAVWDQFMKYLIEKHGKTHGGVISKEVEKALQLLIKKKQ